MANISNTDCIQGWIEILHCKFDKHNFHTAVPSVINGSNLKSLREHHYDVVGSPLPLCEYYAALDVYQQFAAKIDPEFNIPRPFRTYDAINLCVNDPKLGNKVTTLIVVPKGAHTLISYREDRLQYHPNYEHALVIRKKPFKSLLAQYE
jgi:hypothetical protein